MQRAKQLTVCLNNKPGMLAELCRVLANAKVSILAISVVDTAEAGLVRMVVDDPKTATRLLEAKGVSVIQSLVRLVELPNKVGALAELAERLGQRKVNIDYAYGSACGDKCACFLVLQAKK